MYGLVNNYPTTNFHETNLDYIIKLVRENNGLHLDVSGNQLLLKTLDGTTVSSVTVHYAETAGHADTATSANSATFATTATNATNAVNATNAGHALTADNATTAGTALVAQSATTAGTATEAVHATTADTALTANTATRASTADYATTTGNVEHADKAIESVEIDGNNIKFTTYDGTSSTITVPYSVKASRDSSANYINQTYVANVVDNEGTLEFKNAQGNTIVSITPSVETASNDSYGNLIADMIKTIAVSSNSNYVTVTHGTGTVDTLTINYSERAYKDTNDNVIKNTYIKSLAMVEDDNSGHYNLVAYNGDNPTAEIFRLELIAYRAQIADEATHASNADYATNAGTAQTAVTSTGSVSSITRDRATLTITNGDGTTSTVDLFRNSKRYLWVKQSINNNTELLDPAFTVGHSEEFGVDNYNTVWGYDTAFQAMAEGAQIDYVNANSYGLFSSFTQKSFALDNGDPYTTYQIFVFDTVANALKCFEITPPADIDLTPGNVTIKRVL